MNVHTHSVDFARNEAQFTLIGEKGESISIICPLPTPGNQTETQLKEASKEAARSVLRSALAAL